ncbi:MULTISPECIES: hypothetical protein [Pedobacter]|uniref:hypothetical protein n=1 Tax=Pedobacter TaxID=84567 RepID=UPI001E4E80DB|nr:MULTISPECIES: hypothetical protein [Pedobacter]
MIVNDQTPTSTILELKVGMHIDNNLISGNIAHIEIQETDEYLLFLFDLEQGNQIIVRKLKQVC